MHTLNLISWSLRKRWDEKQQKNRNEPRNKNKPVTLGLFYLASPTQYLFFCFLLALCLFHAFRHFYFRETSNFQVKRSFSFHFFFFCIRIFFRSLLLFLLLDLKQIFVILSRFSSSLFHLFSVLFPPREKYLFNFSKDMSTNEWEKFRFVAFVRNVTLLLLLLLLLLVYCCCVVTVIFGFGFTSIVDIDR